MSGTRTTIRDLPTVCLFLAMPFAVFTWLNLQSDVVDRSELQPLNGSIEQVFNDVPRSGPRASGEHPFVDLSIRRDGDEQLFRLVQNFGITYDAPALRDLQRGDRVTTLVQPASDGQSFLWLWELKRGGTTLFSYDNTRQFFASSDDFYRGHAIWQGAIAFGLLVASLVLRLRFGAWTDQELESRK
jgi:hypothetical protein